mgnify:CR=1 FL=1
MRFRPPERSSTELCCVNAQMAGVMLYSRVLPEDEANAFVKYNPEKYIWTFEDVFRIVPVKFEYMHPEKKKMVSAGGQGWGHVPDEIFHKLKRA